ncbi:hypothetical protein ASE16_03235 [Leifsonia sp. Root227]|uniref:alpha/beta hydrolase family protein n=1 Tax=Leifsonia sp. Root227 TaxID=1736496 RepID=UPI0006FEC394|nr:acyl-CoA thioesterase/BAAT N-terminal domain-containing protein [Leifsonia sp. Root227]KRC52083.1 hypothetical protein ASE16_03235 [Leifsonia sp. Root227]
MRARRPRVPLMVAAVVLSVAALAGCGGPPRSIGPRFTVDLLHSGVSDPVILSVVGLQPGGDAVLSATAHTASGVWSAKAVYAVPPNGVIDLWKAKPLLAPYAAADPAALLWSMSGPSLSQSALEQTWAGGDVDIRLAAQQDGREVASQVVHRTGYRSASSTRDIFARDLLSGTDREEDIGGTVFDRRIGTYVAPDPPTEQSRPAVIVIDGDDGGASGAFVAGQLAANGFPAFVLPSFGPTGQIPGSSALSVESFDTARTWLAEQTEVDASRIFVWGSWRAAPLALWFAAAEPYAVYGAIAASGPTALLCTASGGASPLTSDGDPVPCESQVRTIADTPSLRLDRIPGPVVLACGTKDEILSNACDWMTAGEQARGVRADDQFLRAVGSGHTISTPPIVPVGLSDLAPTLAQATERARSAFWVAALSALQGAVE